MAPRPSPFVREPTIPLDLSDWKPRKQLIKPQAIKRAPVKRNNNTVQHTHDLAPVLEPSETNREEVPKTYSLKQYLQESWFPAFKVGPRVKQAFSWPHYPDLQALPGTRKLRSISRIAPFRIRGAASNYIEQQNDKQIERDFLTLPSVSFPCDNRDVRLLIEDVNFVTDITKILKASALRTVERCLYMLLNIPEGEEGEDFRSLVQFKPSFEMCPVKDEIFDVVRLPSPHPGRTSMIILVIPPWALDNMDFISFINTGPVAPGGLDVFPPDKPASAPATMWAVLWDMCSKNKCYYFAVTTYELWAFGNFTSDMKDGFISDLFRAPVHSYDAQVRRDMLTSPTMTETLLFWMAVCMGIGGNGWKPFDDKAAS